MKKLLFFFAIVFSFAKIIAQNVGIGTPTPADKLSVVNALPGYGVTHTYGPVVMGTYISDLHGQFGTKTNHPLQFFTNNGAAQITLLQNGNVGIGTETPNVSLVVAGTIATIGSNGGFEFDDMTGAAKGFKWYSTGGSGYLHEYQAFKNVISISEEGNIGFSIDDPQSNFHVNPSGAGSILIGTDKNSGGYTNLEMGISAQSNGQSYIQSTKASGSTWGTLSLNPSGGDVTVAGNVGIGTNTPFYPLDIVQPNNNDPVSIRILSSGHIWGIGTDGDLVFTHNATYRADIDRNDGSYTTYSDRRLKKNIEEYSLVLDKVLQLKAKKYQFIDTEETTKKSIGFISQEVVDLFPELVHSAKRSAEDSTLYLSLNYAGFSVIAIKAIQEQQTEIDLLKEQNKMILEELGKLKAAAK